MHIGTRWSLPASADEEEEVEAGEVEGEEEEEVRVGYLIKRCPSYW